jgi:hypothetical protein
MSSAVTVCRCSASACSVASPTTTMTSSDTEACTERTAPRSRIVVGCQRAAPSVLYAVAGQRSERLGGVRARATWTYARGHRRAHLERAAHYSREWIVCHQRVLGRLGHIAAPLCARLRAMPSMPLVHTASLRSATPRIEPRVLIRRRAEGWRGRARGLHAHT